MVALTRSEIMKVVNRYIGVRGGYLGDFSYRTHEEFYLEYCDLEDIDPNNYEGTTRERFIEILSTSKPPIQAKILRGILERFQISDSNAPTTRTSSLKNEIIQMIARLEGTGRVEYPDSEITSEVVGRTITDSEKPLGVSPKQIFFCYAHEDEPLLNELKKHLQPLQRQKLISTWHDRDISAGTEWEQKINQHLDTAEIILLLVSPDFMASDYCYDIEMKRAIERHERGEAKVIPIILRPVYWQGAPFGRLQALPKDAKAVMSSDWHNQDEAFFDVADSIRKVIGS